MKGGESWGYAKKKTYPCRQTEASRQLGGQNFNTMNICLRQPTWS